MSYVYVKTENLVFIPVIFLTSLISPHIDTELRCYISVCLLILLCRAFVSGGRMCVRETEFLMMRYLFCCYPTVTNTFGTISLLIKLFVGLCVGSLNRYFCRSGCADQLLKKVSWVQILKKKHRYTSAFSYLLRENVYRHRSILSSRLSRLCHEKKVIGNWVAH